MDNGRYPLIYRKVDFHVHTPISQCYEERMYPEVNRHTKPEDIVSAALEAGVEAIVITDHNSAEGVASMLEAAKGSGLHVFPGMELSLRGGHVLAVFDADTPLRVLYNLLAEVYFPEETWGDGFKQSPVWMDEGFARIEELGGLAIAAHIDREPRGFVAGSESRNDKKRIHASPHLTALEITDPRDGERWKQGKMPHFPKPYPVIQGSDAHAPKEIGRRPVFMAVESWDLAGLRRAFQSYEQTIRFPHEMDNGHHPS